nr:hypothetical protein CFP56_77567 [Quercus suber]
MTRQDLSKGDGACRRDHIQDVRWHTEVGRVLSPEVGGAGVTLIAVLNTVTRSRTEEGKSRNRAMIWIYVRAGADQSVQQHLESYLEANSAVVASAVNMMDTMNAFFRSVGEFCLRIGRVPPLQSSPICTRIGARRGSRAENLYVGSGRADHVVDMVREIISHQTRSLNAKLRQRACCESDVDGEHVGDLEACCGSLSDVDVTAVELL